MLCNYIHLIDDLIPLLMMTMMLESYIYLDLQDLHNFCPLQTRVGTLTVWTG